MKKLPYRPRWVNRWYAKYAGYFWLPCPICGRNFGGHEWRTDLDSSSVPTPEVGMRRGVCPKCVGHPLTNEPTRRVS